MSHINAIIDLLSKIRETQVILQADASNNKVYSAETVENTSKFIESISPLLVQYKKYYSLMLSIFRLSKGKIDKKDIFKVADSPEVKTVYDIKLLQGIISSDDLYAKLREMNIDDEEFNDLVTFSIIPSYFSFWLTRNSIKAYIKFMKLVFKENQDLFYIYARSAFVHPGLCSFISKSIEPVIRRQLGLYKGIINHTETTIQIIKTMKDNLKLCPCFIADLVEIGGDVQTTQKSCFDLMCQFPKIYGVIFFYENTVCDFLTKENEENKSLIDYIGESEIPFLFKKEKTARLTYAFPRNTTKIAEWIEKVHVIDSFDAYEFFNIVSDRKPKATLLSSPSKYTITCILPKEEADLETEMSITHIDEELSSCLRKVLKFLPIIPKFSGDFFPYKIVPKSTEENEDIFSLQKIIGEQIMFADPEHLEYIYTAFSDLLSNGDFIVCNRLAEEKSIKTISEALDKVLYEHQEMEIGLTGAFLAKKFSVSMANQMNEANNHLASLILATICEEKWPKISDEDQRRIVESPQSLIESNSSFVKEINSVVEGVVKNPSPVFQDIIRKLKNHIIFRVIPYERFILMRTDLVAADAVFSEYVRQNKREIINKALDVFGSKRASIEKLLTKRRAFDSIQTLLYDTLIANFDPEQKIENMAAVWKFCQDICACEGMSLSQECILALSECIFAFYNPLRVVSNYVFIREYINVSETPFNSRIVENWCQEATGLPLSSLIFSTQNRSTVLVCGDENSAAKDFILSVTGLRNIPEGQRLFKVCRNIDCYTKNILVVWCIPGEKILRNPDVERATGNIKQDPGNSIVFACEKVKEFSFKVVYRRDKDIEVKKIIGAVENILYDEKDCENMLLKVALGQ